MIKVYLLKDIFEMDSSTVKLWTSSPIYVIQIWVCVHCREYQEQGVHVAKGDLLTYTTLWLKS